jgi:hypothetical protein
MTSRTLTVVKIGAPALFLGCAAYELVSIALGHTWPQYVSEVRDGLGVLAAALWIASAVVLALGTRKALYVPVFGAFMILTHAFVARAGGSTRELVYLAVFPFIVALETADIRLALGKARLGAIAAPPPPAMV